MKSLVFTFIIACILSFSASAQPSGSIPGTVIDKSTQIPLSNVNIKITDSKFGPISDSLGSFRITVPIMFYRPTND